MRSYLEHHPFGKAFVLLVDHAPEGLDRNAEPFVLETAGELALPGLRDLAFRSDVVEFSTALKAEYLRHLFTKHGIERVCYFDPDIVIYEPLEELGELLRQHRIVLTPHLLDPVDDDRTPSERSILLAGSYNLGFIGLSRAEEVDAFLAWWTRRLATSCVRAPERGLFVDQRWIDLVPGLFDGVHVTRDPGYNVAYWNLAQRRIARVDGKLVAGGARLKFFHFSGFVPEEPQKISRHQDRLTWADLSEEKSLFLDYRERLMRAGYREASRTPYGFGVFDDGVPIPAVARYAWRDAASAGRWQSPFEVGPGSFREWLNEPAEGTWGRLPQLSRLAMWIYEAREDLQKAFPQVVGRDRRAYVEWVLHTGAREHGLAPVFLERMKQSLAEASLRDSRTAWPTRLRSRIAYAASRASRARSLTPIKALLSPEQKAAARRVVNRVARAPAVSLRPASPMGERAAGVNLVGYFRSNTGVAEIARGMRRALEAIEEPLAVTTIDPEGRVENGHGSPGNADPAAPYDVTLLNVNADQIRDVAHRLGEHYFAGRASVGFFFWELETFPDKWAQSFESLEEVWVASDFVRSSIGRSSPVPVVRIPPVVSVPDVTGDTARFGLPRDRKIFLCAFDALSVPVRKNPFGVVEAFRRAFGSASREACLVVKVSNLHLARAAADQLGLPRNFAEELSRAVESVSGRFVDETLDRSQMMGLLAACDSFVSLHRAEGFGLLLAEAMALGKPCIATGYSGNADFMNVENSYPVDHRLIEIEQDAGPYLAGQRWADPDLDHAAAQMRTVVDEPNEAAARAEIGRGDVRAAFSPSAVGAILRERTTALRAALEER